MAMTVDTLIDAIEGQAALYGGASATLLGQFDDTGNLGYEAIAPTKVRLAARSELYSTLERLPEPEQADLSGRIDVLVSKVATLYGENFPEIALDLANRATVATAISAMLATGANLSGTNYLDELTLEQLKLDEDLLLSERRVKESWASRGFSLAPGQMTRQLSEEYTVKFQSMHQARMAIMDRAFTSVLPQFKAAVQQAQDMALSAKAVALSATADVIRTAAREGARPAEQYGARVEAYAAMSNALMAQFQASKHYDRLLLETYGANLGNESVVNNYLATMYPRDVQNQVQLAVAKATSAGNEAGALWDALNVVVGSSTISFG